jgi:hypothetical protein
MDVIEVIMTILRLLSCMVSQVSNKDNFYRRELYLNLRKPIVDVRLNKENAKFSCEFPTPVPASERKESSRKNQ